MKPTAELLSLYFENNYGASPGSVDVSFIGSGSHGSGFMVGFDIGGVEKRLIVKKLDGRVGLGHDYTSDRAAVFIQARNSYGRLPGHVHATDVLAAGKDGRIFSIDGGAEYYLVMEEARGRSYFSDLDEIGGKKRLDASDKARIRAMVSYLARIHSKKKAQPGLYLRKLRDTVGHGECLMGVLDTYVDGAGFTNLTEMAAIEKACVDWRARLKPLTARLSMVHGDFHPGNILFRAKGSFILLDRSRGEYGEPSDDLTALTINYIFFSLIRHGKIAGAYDEALALFYEEYIGLTGDGAVRDVAALFYAFRGVVVANPLFYPDVSVDVRKKVFGFIHGVLRADSFDPAKVNNYIKAGSRYRKRFF